MNTEMKTWNAKPASVTKAWVLIDATQMVPGRLASLIAARLIGKHLPIYTPNVDCGDNVVVVHAEKIAFSGKKTDDKKYYRHTGHPGGIKTTTPADMLGSRHPERVLRLAVRRMLGDGPLARQHLANLHIYAGGEHPHEAQSPQVLELAKQNRKNVRVAN